MSRCTRLVAARLDLLGALFRACWIARQITLLPTVRCMAMISLWLRYGAVTIALGAAAGSGALARSGESVSGRFRAG
jgi:hypothetical protein